MEMKMKTWFDLEFDLAGSPVVDPVGEPPIIWLDIETRKVPAPESWPQKRRWAPFLIGIAGAMDPGVLFAEVRSGSESELIDWIGEFAGFEIRYSASREFDEMVLRGRFTNARRAHSPVAGRWPNLNRADVRWKNLRKTERPRSWVRAFDLPSRDVPGVWESGGRKLVAQHCLRDVLENVLRDSEVQLSNRLRRRVLRLVC
jgi:hypothetical protein